jgi:hypothetical protein
VRKGNWSGAALLFAVMDLNDFFRSDVLMSGRMSAWLEPLYQQWVIQHNSAILERQAGTEEFPIPTLTHEEFLAQTHDGKTIKIFAILGIILWIVIFGCLL